MSGVSPIEKIFWNIVNVHLTKQMHLRQKKLDKTFKDKVDTIELLKVTVKSKKRKKRITNIHVTSVS
jgi:hypothetical protein